MLRSDDQRAQLAPAEVDARVESLGVELTLRGEAWRRARSALRRGASTPDGISDRGREVGQLHRCGDALALSRGLRELQHQRNLERFAIEEDPVLVFAVIAEAFAVIRDQQDHGAVVDALRLQIVEKLADDVVRRRHLAVVCVA